MKNGMSRWKRFALGLILLLGAASAKAEAPAHCSYGYQDSSCLGPQYRAPQTPPTCSTGVGWTTLTPAKWIGSGFTQPACHYDAPPTCAPGYDQQSAPVWNGSEWVGLVCVPQARQVTPPTQLAACEATGNFPGTIAGTVLRPPASQYAISSSGTMTGAASYSNVYMPVMNGAGSIAPNLYCNGAYPATTGSMPVSSDGNVYDIFVAQAGQIDANTGQPGIVAASICYLQTGTNNVAYLLLVGMMKNPGTCH
ncbi:hypothetical protein M3I53_16355 [Paraburkholderia sp. CNPSo 3272]|uniref:hypothetical protein n=1 Tax=Paraburkholderia sp. CNPSo 3272 TaxID=2940931 RepID=UPI0020B76707|nr:hypothetical protein [Paraburkholderia sp. CNPSo 3272]MCP3724678.1 hypothetical protein [Paraburkholderia sp. CNPSo 3272]